MGGISEVIQKRADGNPEPSFAVVSDNRVKWLSPNRRFVIALHSPDEVVETDPTSDGDCDYNYRYIVMPVRS